MFNFKKHNLVFIVHYYVCLEIYIFMIKFNLKNFENIFYLMIIHFILYKYLKEKIKFLQKDYDNLFFSIENDLRELGFGDVTRTRK